MYHTILTSHTRTTIGPVIQVNRTEARTTPTGIRTSLTETRTIRSKATIKTEVKIRATTAPTRTTVTNIATTLATVQIITIRAKATTATEEVIIIAAISRISRGREDGSREAVEGQEGVGGKTAQFALVTKRNQSPPRIQRIGSGRLPNSSIFLRDSWTQYDVLTSAHQLGVNITLILLTTGVVTR